MQVVSNETNSGSKDVSALSWDGEADRLRKLRTALTDVIREVGALGITYGDLEKISGVPTGTIKQVVRRNSRQPRASSVDRKIGLAISKFGDRQKFGFVRSLPALKYYLFGRRSSKPINDQVDRYYKFFFSSFRSSDIEKEISIARLFQKHSSAGVQLRFFSLARYVKDPSRIEKCEYIFFRGDREYSKECFFRRSRPDRSVQFGIVRSINDHISLYSFEGDNEAPVTIHIKCLHSERQAYGLDISTVGDRFVTNLMVLLPEDQVQQKEISMLEFNSSSPEISAYIRLHNHIFDRLY